MSVVPGDAPACKPSGAALRSAPGVCGACVWALFVLCGCAPARVKPLPTYRWTDAQSALRTIDQRARLVHTVSAQCLMTLRRPNGESVRLDGVLVMAPPEKSVHLRAWKFNQPVFDLTLIPRGLWIESPRDEARRQALLPASLSAAKVAKVMAALGGGLLEGPDVRVIDPGGARFEIRKPLGDGQTLSEEIDRATLTVRRYRLVDPVGRVRFSLLLQQYHDLGGIVWPTRLVASSGNGDIELELREVELNAPLPEHAFDPPPRAEKVE